MKITGFRAGRKGAAAIVAETDRGDVAAAVVSTRATRASVATLGAIVAARGRTDYERAAGRLAVNGPDAILSRPATLAEFLTIAAQIAEAR